KIVASPVRVGTGHARCAHGILPVPAPATEHILRGVPVYGGEYRGELCTPTGAALLKTFVDEYPSGARIRNDGQHEQFLAQNHHVAIIDKELFDAVQAARLARTNVTIDEDGNRVRKSIIRVILQLWCYLFHLQSHP
ncbi:MAG: DUF111 family protein, partial [Paenibacillus sp.]|uniref:nickel insertion protein n=1 Tax=Paenibacillus sp. TaxID=58172 RepID=UPI0025D05522